MSLAVIERLLLSVGALTHLGHFFCAERTFHELGPAIDHLAITVRLFKTAQNLIRDLNGLFMNLLLWLSNVCDMIQPFVNWSRVPGAGSPASSLSI